MKILLKFYENKFINLRNYDKTKLQDYGQLINYLKKVDYLRKLLIYFAFGQNCKIISMGS